MLSRGSKSQSGTQPFVVQKFPAMSQFVGKKYSLAAKKMRYINKHNLGNIQPEDLARTGKLVTEKVKNVGSLLMLKPKSAAGKSVWSEVEQQHVGSFSGGQQPQPESGTLSRGSVIQKFDVFPKPGQSIDAFKEQAQKIPASKKATSRPQAARPAPPPRSRMFSHVQEISPQSPAQPKEQIPDIPAPAEKTEPVTPPLQAKEKAPQAPPPPVEERKPDKKAAIEKLTQAAPPVKEAPSLPKAVEQAKLDAKPVQKEVRASQEPLLTAKPKPKTEKPASARTTAPTVQRLVAKPATPKKAEKSKSIPPQPPARKAPEQVREVSPKKEAPKSLPVEDITKAEKPEIKQESPEEIKAARKQEKQEPAELLDLTVRKPEVSTVPKEASAPEKQTVKSVLPSQTETKAEAVRHPLQEQVLKRRKPAKSIRKTDIEAPKLLVPKTFPIYNPQVKEAVTKPAPIKEPPKSELQRSPVPGTLEMLMQAVTPSPKLPEGTQPAPVTEEKGLFSAAADDLPMTMVKRPSALFTPAQQSTPAHTSSAQTMLSPQTGRPAQQSQAPTTVPVQSAAPNVVQRFTDLTVPEIEKSITSAFRRKPAAAQTQMQPQSSPQQASPPEIDLDKIAEDVYPIVKRLIEMEAERTSRFF